MNLKVFFHLIRYKSYIKNLIIFLPLFLTYSNWSTLYFFDLFVITAFFCLLASSVYILNDIFDIELDKKHLKKKFRPIARGLIKKKNALLISIFLAIFALVFFYFFSENSIFILTLSYLIINILYSYLFKKIKYLDLANVLSGFLIRIYIGSLTVGLVPSNYLLLQVIFFVLFILICKRREYFFSFEKKTFSKYSLYELNFLSKFFLILNISNYFIYLFQKPILNDSLALPISFLIYSLLVIRYFIINFKNKKFDPVSIYFNDKLLISVSLLYIINILCGFYDLY